MKIEILTSEIGETTNPSHKVGQKLYGALIGETALIPIGYTDKKECFNRALKVRTQILNGTYTNYLTL